MRSTKASASYPLLCFNPLNEGCRFGHVGQLPSGQTQPQGIPQGFNRHMNFGAQPPSAPSDGLLARFFGAPVACWWARTMVESTNNCSRSASRVNASAIRAQTLSCSSEKSACTPCATRRSAGVGRATASLCGRSTTPLRQRGDCHARSSRARWPCLSTTARFVSIGRRATSSGPSSHAPKSENVPKFAICEQTLGRVVS